MGSEVSPTANLTETQAMAAYYLAMGLSRKEVAAKAGTTEKSLSVWSNHNDDFKVELERWKAVELDRLGTTLVRAQLAALGLTEQAATVLQSVMDETDEETGLPTTRAVKAAIEVFRKLPLGETRDGSEGGQAIAQAAVIIVQQADDGSFGPSRKVNPADIVLDAVEV